MAKKLERGAFISAKGRNGKRLKSPDVKGPGVEEARGRSGQRLKWPGDKRAGDGSGQKHDVINGDVNIAGSCRWAG